MAPDANVVYYGAASCYDDDLMTSMARAVSENKASLVSNSWGEPSFVVVNGQQYPTIDNGLIAAYEDILKQGAAQGIGFYFSSGDSGDDAAVNGGQPQADYPSADPYVTAVGGTALAAGATGSRQFETGWGTQKYSLTSTGWSSLGFLYGAGGGIADTTAYPALARPDYQTKAGFTASGRSEPDIAADADPTTGMLVGETQTFPNGSVRYGEYRIGGTSLSSPLLAGYIADASQLAGSRVGFINPALYSLAGQGASSIRDVRSPRTQLAALRRDYNNGANGKDGTTISLRSMNFDTSLKTTPGYDNVTGLGVPGAAGSLMEDLAGSSFPAP
jgi:subtilase family serine protease